MGAEYFSSCSVPDFFLSEFLDAVYDPERGDLNGPEITVTMTTERHTYT